MSITLQCYFIVLDLLVSQLYAVAREKNVKLEQTEQQLETPYGLCRLSRIASGIPVIKADNEEALFFGQGFVQLNDRQLQAYQLKIIFSGRAAECLGSKLLPVDKYIRRFPFQRDWQEQQEKLSEGAQKNSQAYLKGLNYWQNNEKPAWEWKLIGYQPEEWTMEDLFAIANGFGYLGLADGQAKHEAFIIEMIRNGIDLKVLRDLFPIIEEDIPVREICRARYKPVLIPEEIRWAKAVPDFKASNNWAISPDKSLSGQAILASDPHLQVDRIPAIWQEMVLQVKDRAFKGFGIPGIPGPLVGKTPDIAWGPTYSYLDSSDYYLEEIKDSCYKREDQWIPLEVREEIISVKGRKQDVVQRFYESDIGLIEGYDGEDGIYFCQSYSAARHCGANEINGIMELFHAPDTSSAMELFKVMESPSFNWIIADSQGNIGYQMSGRSPKRPQGQSGIVPQPAWNKEKLPQGYVAVDDLPRAYNPEEGYLISANEDRNIYGNEPVCTLPMASYRADRIEALIRSKEKLSLEDMKIFQLDNFSMEARLFMDELLPLLPKTGNGDILRRWDCCYNRESQGAYLFEKGYRFLIEELIAKPLVGKDCNDYLWEETGEFNGLYGYFDRLALKEESSIFTREKKQALLAKTVMHIMAQQPKSFAESRPVTMKHIFFGDILPSFLGFDLGPYSFEGSRATVNQGQFYRSAGRSTSFCPSLRFIADLGQEEVYTTLIGGTTDRRFSKHYKQGVEDHLHGKFKSY